MRSQSKWVKSYWKKISTKLSEEKKSNINLNNEFNFFGKKKEFNSINFKITKNNKFNLNGYKTEIITKKKFNSPISKTIENTQTDAEIINNIKLKIINNRLKLFRFKKLRSSSIKMLNPKSKKIPFIMTKKTLNNLSKFPGFTHYKEKKFGIIPNKTKLILTKHTDFKKLRRMCAVAIEIELMLKAKEEMLIIEYKKLHRMCAVAIEIELMLKAKEERLIKEERSIKEERLAEEDRLVENTILTFYKWSALLKKPLNREWINHESSLVYSRLKTHIFTESETHKEVAYKLNVNKIIAKKKIFVNFFFLKNTTNSYLSKNFVYCLDENTRDIRTPTGKIAPLYLVKYPINKNSPDNKPLFKLRFNDNNINTNHRVSQSPKSFCFIQKRYKRRKLITPIEINYKNKKKESLKFESHLSLKDNYKILAESNVKKKLTIMHKLIRKSRSRNDNMNVTVSKRLLRVKRTLVIPTHVNITAITNSYDVVHSWFIPGLGLKMDCVPGRSTHHTFYVDNAGFYYGQCAEICGRYHHHMPIRVCALPFEHFLLWWNTFGLPKLIKNKNKSIRKEYSFRKFVW